MHLALEFTSQRTLVRLRDHFSTIYTKSETFTDTVSFYDELRHRGTSEKVKDPVIPA